MRKTGQVSFVNSTRVNVILSELAVTVLLMRIVKNVYLIPQSVTMLQLVHVFVIPTGEVWIEAGGQVLALLPVLIALDP